MGLFDLVNDIPEKRPSEPELIEINIDGIKYIIEGRRIKKCKEKYIQGGRTDHRAWADHTIEQHSILTIRQETTLPGIYKCTYSRSEYSKGRVYYIGLEPKKALSDVYYICYLFEKVEKVEKIMDSIVFMEEEQFKKFDFENVGNYIGTIVLNDNGELTIIQDEKAYEFSKQTPEMIRLKLKARILKLQYELQEVKENNSESRKLEEEITRLKAHLDKIEKQIEDINNKDNEENNLGGHQR